MHINISTLLDVAIGLIFIFFVFSIFVSGIVELINTFREERANLLRLALKKILDNSVATDFFNHQLVKVKQQRFFGLKPINYLSADSFSTVLIDLLVKSGGSVSGRLPATQKTFKAIQQAIQNPNLQEVRKLVEPMLAKSDDFQTFKAELEKWYNGYMEQVSGWFKRYAQGVVWIVAAIVSLALNVDTLYLTDRLFNDNGLRERLVSEAIQATENGGQSFQKDADFVAYLKQTKSKLVQSQSVAGKKDSVLLKPTLTPADKLAAQSAYIQFVQTRVADLKLPIGWVFTGEQGPFQPGQDWRFVLFGWVLTVAALSFGAPFWFDLLLKLVNIRNTARRPPGNPGSDK